MHSQEIDVGMGQRINRCGQPPASPARLEIYIDLWENAAEKLIAAINTARDELCVDIDIEQVEGMSCINVEGQTNDVSLFHSRLLAEGVIVSTTKSR
jgi:hypothetical protein